MNSVNSAHRNPIGHLASGAIAIAVGALTACGGSDNSAAPTTPTVSADSACSGLSGQTIAAANIAKPSSGARVLSTKTFRSGREIRCT